MTRVIVEKLRDLKDHLGEDLGFSEWVTITQEQINAFADATGDHQWIHVDVERARRESPFQQTIAHGYLTLSLAPVLIGQIGTLRGYRTVINHGFDRVRLKEPVPAGSRVRMSARIKSVRDVRGGGVRVCFGLTFEVEGRRKPACLADAILVYLP